MSDALPDLEPVLRQLGADVADLPFWEGTREGRFLLHRCDICGTHYWPASCCVAHGGQAMQWVDASGRGSLYTYTIMHHAYTAAMKDKVPYVVGVVKLTEGPFFHSNVIGVPVDEVAVGMELAAEMEPHESGLTLPMFRRASGG